MNANAELLLRLLRTAFEKENPASLPLGVDWRGVIDYAVQQGVAAIAVDGLQYISDECSDQDFELDKPEFEDLKYDFFGYSFTSENEYESLWKAACDMTELFRENGIRVFVMKGFALGQYYPVPEHRPCGDLDCFLLGDYDKGNRLIESLGINVRYDLYKHSKYSYKGLTVENHQFCIPIRGSRRNKALESYLESNIERQSPAYIGSSHMETPSVMFNALFLTVHALNHFLSEGLLLRHICDWGMFLNNCGNEVDWLEFESLCDKYGLLRFAQSMTRLSKVVCGVGCEWIKDDMLLPGDYRLLDDILNHSLNAQIKGGTWKQRLNIVRNKFRNGWKYRLFSDQSVIGDVLNNFLGLVFDHNPQLP